MRPKTIDPMDEGPLVGLPPTDTISGGGITFEPGEAYDPPSLEVQLRDDELVALMSVESRDFWPQRPIRTRLGFLRRPAA